MAVCKLKTAPSGEPVSLEEVKAHLRITQTEDDTYLESLIKAARQYVEQLCGPLLTQVWEQYQDAWPAGAVLELKKPRVQSADFSIDYTNASGVSATLAAVNYTLSLSDEYRPKVVLKDTASWPTTDLFNVDAIKITFKAGYGTAATAVPEPLRQAMLLVLGHWYEERQIIVVGRLISEMPFAVQALLANYRMW